MTDIIYCSGEAKSQSRLLTNLESLGSSLAFVESYDQLQKQNAHRHAILVFDFDFLSTLDDGQLREIEDHYKAPFILVSSQGFRMNVVQLKRTERISHVINRATEASDADLKKILEQVLKQQRGGFESVGDVRDIFQIDPKKVTSFMLEDSLERWECYKKLTEHVSKLPVFSGFDDIAATVASELITNAFYNGPQTEKGLSTQPLRSESVKIDPPKKIEFCYWSDEEYFWVMVVDPFGTLKKSKLIASLHRAVTERKVNLESPGGAGLGLSMISEWASELYFGLKESESTWIAARLKITTRRKIFFDQRSSLHIYEINQDEGND